MNMEKAFDRVSVLLSDDISSLMSRIPSHALGRLRSHAVGYCYDRQMCEYFGIDYSDVRENDIRRLTIYHAFLEGDLR